MTAFAVFALGLATLSSLIGFEVGKRVEYWRFKKLIRAKKEKKQ